MKESAQAAVTYLRANANACGLEDRFNAESDIHIHVPAGAIPKDGPSAGVTLFTALLSLFSGRPVKSDVAMTGEITLRGMVLPVGGIKEKVLAAHRAGIKMIIMPAANERDLVDVPENVKKKMTFKFAERIGQLEAWALEPVKGAKKAKPKATPKAGAKKQAKAKRTKKAQASGSEAAAEKKAARQKKA
ncbi:MAG: hypothetical protein KUA39_01795, partial [Desulfarculus sp.]|nr:hypothetical protein [Desulfarculus sp.]